MIETVAINQLEARRERLVAQQTQARYGVADSYDRAARAQSGVEEPLMRRLTIPIVLAPALIVGCAARTTKTVTTAGTLAELRNVRPDVQEVKVEQGLDQAMHELPALPRGDTGDHDDAGGDAASRGPAAREAVRDTHGRRQAAGNGRAAARPGTRGRAGRQPDQAAAVAAGAGSRESDQDFERRTTAESEIPAGSDADASPAGGRAGRRRSRGPARGDRSL